MNRPSDRQDSCRGGMMKMGVRISRVELEAIRWGEELHVANISKLRHRINNVSQVCEANGPRYSC